MAATQHIREKINTLNNLILNEDVQCFTQQLVVDAAAKSTGDAQVDQQMQAAAQNAKAVVLASQRRLQTFQDSLTVLQAELDAASKPAV